MNIDINKNSYTLIFSTIMVVVVAAVLSFTASSLKPLQDSNTTQEKMQNILSSVGVEVTRAEAAEKYPEIIKQELVLRDNKIVDGLEAFEIEIGHEIRKPIADRDAPLYVAEIDGSTYYIVPIYGSGLWGPIWGYISLQDDINTIFGAVFDHEGETPGLGAEIREKAFGNQFKGKKILDDNLQFVGIDVIKGSAKTIHEVDGISGGTSTSTGVEEMIKDCLQAYIPYLKENNSAFVSASALN